SYARIFNPQFKIDRSDALLPPIEGSNAELGVKGEWFAKRLNGSLAVFRTRQDNTAEFDIFTNGHSTYKPVHAQSTGFELDLAGRLAPGWEASAGYTQMTIKDRTTGGPARTYVPRKTLRAATSYRLRALPALKVGARMKWQDDIHRDQGAGIFSRQDAYALLDLMARYDFNKNVSATLNLDNVTDEKYITSLYWSQGYYGAPRSASLSLNWQY
ncbi:TonB-dependent siderophore receptor, partial [Piscinibacter sp.]|uniref:TonB-dependent siderophore receptor n=1 Tax=Piscinibacter sp. TaxID=1903157 RepID=UPI002C4F2127